MRSLKHEQAWILFSNKMSDRPLHIFSTIKQFSTGNILGYDEFQGYYILKPLKMFP